MVITGTINRVVNHTGGVDNTLLDLTNDTVSKSNLEKNQTAHDKEGEKVTGEMVIEDAEAYARGTRNGIEVGQDDVAYHNNSLYYSIVSGSAMRIAGEQASAAYTSGKLAQSYADGDAVDEHGQPFRPGQETDNGKYYLEQIRGLTPGSVLNIIAPNEATSESTRNYDVGDQLIYGGILYTATEAIEIGDTITPGTNCDPSDTVAEQLGEISIGLYIDGNGLICQKYLEEV